MNPAAESMMQYAMNSMDMLLPFIVVVLSALFLVWLGKSKSRSEGGNKQLRRLPPSPPGLPLVGNLHQLGSLPHRSLRALSRRHGPLMLLRLGQVPTLVVSSAEAARAIMKTHDLVFASRPLSTATRRLTYGYKDVALAPYGEYWRQARRICILHLLSSKQVQSFRSVREEEVASLLDDISAAASLHRPVNLSQKLSELTSGITCRITMGKKYSGKEVVGKDFRELLREFMWLLGTFKVGDFIPPLAWVDRLSGFEARLEKHFGEMDEFLEKVIEEHLAAAAAEDCKGDRKNDLVDILLSLPSESDSSIDRDGIKALILEMFSGGTDTTFTAAEWTMAELARHPTVMKKAQDEVRAVAGGRKALVGEDEMERLSYLKMVVKEALRLHPPVPLLVPRESLADVELDGHHIPAKTRVLVNAWAIGRDPGLWERAEEFWPERFAGGSLDFRGQNFQFTPFGAGRRGCPGVAFAMAVAELALANLLCRFDWVVPDGSGGEDMDMTEAQGIVVYKKASVVLVPVPPPPFVRP